MLINEATAIITGAAGGIGRAIVLDLLQQGARVLACDVEEDGLNDLANQCSEFEGSLLTTFCDITQESDVKNCVNFAYQKFNSCNILINNAGILRDGKLAQLDSHGEYIGLPLAQWLSVIDTNLTGPMLMTREILLHWLPLGAQSNLIINFSSMSAKGNSGQSAYSASKAGLNALTSSWAKEFSDYGIRVAGISPGLFDTPMALHLEEEDRNKIISLTLAKRAGRPHELAKLVETIILCDFISGRTLEIDGGGSF
jgi:3-oxoacyl-[acyl-carrier protein] reductase